MGVALPSRATDLTRDAGVRAAGAVPRGGVPAVTAVREVGEGRLRIVSIAFE